jgi:hypothetical protein
LDFVARGDDRGLPTWGAGKERVEGFSATLELGPAFKLSFVLFL